MDLRRHCLVFPVAAFPSSVLLRDATVRWSIRWQLLLPMLGVVVVAILGSSAMAAYLAADWARERQEDSLGRVVATLTDASFPLNEAVLKKMSGLSGAEFVVLGADGARQKSSRPLAESDVAALRNLPRQANLAGFSSSRTLEFGGNRFLASRLAVASTSDRNDSPVTLIVLYPEERWAVARRQVIYPPLVAGGIAAVLAVAIAALLARRVVQPLEALQRKAAAIERGDFSPMPLAARNDEIQDLARSINRMVERLARYEADVRQNERLRTLGQLGAGIAHQLRNAATGARLALDLHRQECPLEPACESLEVAGRQFTVMENYLKRFLTLGRRESGQFEKIDLAALVNDVLPLVRPACGHARVELRFERPDAPAVVSGNQQSLTQLLINLLTNAIEAAAAHPSPRPAGPSIGAVQVEISTDGNGCAECRIGDTGEGPSPAVAATLFEPFVSDKPDGTGLGLAVVRQIADEHGANLSWNRAAGMTWFVVAFPAMSSAAAAPLQLTTDN